MKEVKLSIPDDVLIVSITIVSEADSDDVTWVKVEAFAGSDKEHEIKWGNRKEARSEQQS